MSLRNTLAYQKPSMTKQISTVFLLLTLLSCQTNSSQETQAEDSTNPKIAVFGVNGLSLHESENLTIKKLTTHVYQHISYLDTEEFGRVACNGMVVVSGNEAVVFDTPTDDVSAQELIDYLTNELKCKINGVVATHFHADCLGGIDAFHKNNIPSYASNRTIELLKSKESSLPQNGFDEELTLKVGDQKVYGQFVGEGHTRDNVIGYFPEDKVMFGGCLIKEMGGAKGNLEDANVAAWPETVRKVKAKYPQTMVVIPGHGKAGGRELLDYTVRLFQ